MNKGDKAYVNLDQLLQECLTTKASSKSKGKEPQAPISVEFMKRDELVKSVIAKMQSWYEIRVPGKDPVQK